MVLNAIWPGFHRCSERNSKLGRHSQLHEKSLKFGLSLKKKPLESGRIFEDVGGIGPSLAKSLSPTHKNEEKQVFVKSLFEYEDKPQRYYDSKFSSPWSKDVVLETTLFSENYFGDSTLDDDISGEYDNLSFWSVDESRHGLIHNDDSVIFVSPVTHITLSSETSREKNDLRDGKTKAVTVNYEFNKTNKTQNNDIKQNIVLVLNTGDDIRKLTDDIEKTQNYNLVESKLIDKYKSSNRDTLVGYGNKAGSYQFKSDLTKFHYINSLLDQLRNKYKGDSSDVLKRKIVRDDARDMSRNSDKCDLFGRTSHKRNRNGSKSPQGTATPRDVKSSFSERASSSVSKKSTGSYSARNVDVQFNVSPKAKSNKTSIIATNIPQYKIVAGTHFAVDAFSYGEIPNVKHYFLTHFHSDQYTGLKKSFSKVLYCSKITADLCVTRLGVNRKCINVLNLDNTIKIEGVEITVVDANHCPGAIMLVFTLPNGKTMLHTGDFRATPTMETYPVFWNKDIHTVYLDTTYCNPRFNFPTQDQSLDTAVYLLRQKEKTLQDAKKSFSRVLIVCGTYTVGKEKFFLGLARRMCCSVWACPEKDRVLQIVEARSFNKLPRHQCQLHVVPMRDITLENLRSYLDSLQGAFDEIVAFKPSGWENSKNSIVEKDSVTIHGIPYSEHSSFLELIRFIKFLKPKLVIPTVDISGGIKSVQKYFQCPLINKDDIQYQAKPTEFFAVQK